MNHARSLNRAAGLGLLAAAVFILAACGAKTKYADPEAANPKGGIGIASKDMIAAVEQATSDMTSKVDRFQLGGQPPIIAFYSIQNNTSQAINKDMFLRRIRATMLNKSEGKFRFLEEAALQRIDEIRAQKRAGQISHKELKELFGADYLLTGALDSITDVEGRYKSNFVQMTFRLTDTETGEVVWENLYDFKKERTDPWWK